MECMGAVYAVHRNKEGDIIKKINPNTYGKTTDSGEGYTYEYELYRKVYTSDSARWHSKKSVCI